MGFQHDIKSRNTELFPIVTIEAPFPTSGDDVAGGWVTALEKVICLSTNNIALNHIHYGWGATSTGWRVIRNKFNFLPLIMKAPTIKESIDIKTKKIKVSSMSLDISNYEYQGKRFSEIFKETSLINYKISVQFVSPTAKRFSTIRPHENFGGTTETRTFYDAYTSDFGQSGDPTADPPTIYFDPNRRDHLAEMVFQGIIRKATHDDKKVTIQAEDLLGVKEKKELPNEFTSYSENLDEEHRGLPIPIVFGEIEKSPLVMSEIDEAPVLLGDAIDSSSELDYTDDENGNPNQHPVSIFKSNMYLNVFKENDLILQSHTVYMGEKRTYGSSTQYIYEYGDPFVSLNPNFGDWHQNDGYQEISSLTPLIDGFLFVRILDGPIAESIKTPGNNYTAHVPAGVSEWGIVVGGQVFFNEYPESWTDYEWNHTEPEESATLGHRYGGGSTEDNPYWVAKYYRQFNFAKAPGVVKTYEYRTHPGADPQPIPLIQHCNFSTMYSLSLTNMATDMPTGAVQNFHENILVSFSLPSMKVTGIHDINYPEYTFDRTPGATLIDLNVFPEDISTDLNYDSVPYETGNMLEQYSWADQQDWTGSTENLSLSAHGYESHQIIHQLIDGGSTTQFDLKLEIEPAEDGKPKIEREYQYFLQDALQSKFYGHMLGRSETVGGTTGRVTHPIKVIRYIIEEFIDGLVDEDSYTEALDSHTGWFFDFSIHKTISIKKLLEGLLACTKCTLYHGKDGRYVFATERSSYEPEDYESATTIESREIISCKFSDTGFKNIATEVKVEFAKDYGMKKYTDDITKEHLGMFFGYYGMPGFFDPPLDMIAANGNFNYNNSQEENPYNLKTDYIQDYNTANYLALHLIATKGQPHLLAKLTLPIKYMGLSVGKLIKFTELVDGMESMGIDYTKGAQFPDIDFVADGYYHYPLFLITSVTKKIDSVSVEGYQLHRSASGSEDGWGDYE